MKKLYLVSVILLISCSLGLSQNIKFDNQRIAFYRYPLKPLDKSFKTYSSSLQELNVTLANDMRDSLKRSLVIPGYERQLTGGDFQIELIISPLSITNKELKDQPLENEKDGKKTVVHQYWYEIKYAFPVKVRLVNKSQTINETDMPGFFTTEYFSEDRTSQGSLQRAFDSDTYFLDKLKYKRVDELKYEIRRMLASQYGYGMAVEFIDIGYIKDKKGEYADLTKAMSIMHEAFAYANNKHNYVDDFFKSRINEAIIIYNKVLLESSDDKKARIDPFVTGMIQYNLALANYGLNEFDKAMDWSRKIKDASRGDGSVYSRLKENIEDKRNRMIANGMIAGAVHSVDVIKPLEATIVSTMAPITYRDFVIGKSGDTLDVKIIIPSKEIMPFGDSLWMQDKVNILSEGKSVELLPSDINGYSYQGIYRQSLSWVKDSKTIPFTVEWKFCKRAVHGSISVYNCYATEPGFRDPSTTVVATTMWYTKGGVPEIVGFLNFNKGASKLVADYPELSERVKNGVYKREDFLKIIQEYNQWRRTKI